MGVTHVLPWGAPLSYDDLQAMPDDGHRYELVDGVLIVTPAPRVSHQRAVARLIVLLAGAAGDEHDVLPAPFDYKVSDLTVLQPDLLVARRTDLGAERLERTPLLVVEVQSPSTRRIDLGTKRLAFEGAGVPWYWLIDPETFLVEEYQHTPTGYLLSASVPAGQPFRPRLFPGLEIDVRAIASGVEAAEE